MALMLSKTYDALKEAGASEAAAREASEELADVDRRLRRLEVMVSVLFVLQVAQIGLLLNLTLR